MQATLRRHRFWQRSLPCLVVMAMIVPELVLSTTPASALSSDRSPIPGHLIPALQNHAPLSMASSKGQFQLAIALNLRNTAALNALLQAENDPHSPLYHRYLTPQQFAEQFAPATADVNKVAAYLRSQGLQVTSISPNNTLINASGSLATISQAFAINIANYSFEGRTVYAPTNEPSVPSDLNGLILHISGLDNVEVQQHAALSLALHGSTPARGPTGGYTPAELRTGYDMNPLLSNTNGNGQTVAIFELDGYLPSDVNTYLTQYGLGSAKYSNVLVDGATNTPGSGAIEVELDMEAVSAIAPGANQKIYIGPNTGSGVLDTYNKIVTDDLAPVVSTSWGLCEPDASTGFLTALHNIFMQGASQGQATFSASGDMGAFECGGASVAVQSPSDDPSVVGAGGTTLIVDSSGNYVSETGWSGSGGGYSAFFSKPSYQTGPGVDSDSFRHVPDVSADADPGTGYSIYCTVAVAGCPGTGWFVVGGTSAAAPLWAGIATDLNAYLLSQSKPTLGSASAELYSLFNTSQTFPAYQNIVAGTNGFYNAGPGYDLVTGIGTPNVWNMARDLASKVSVPLTVTVQNINPVEGATFKGTVAIGTFSGSGTLTASINWGDGLGSSTGTVTTSGTNFTVTGTHRYGEEGTYTLMVTVTDANGHTASNSQTISVSDASLTQTLLIVIGAGAHLGIFNQAHFLDANTLSTAADFTATVNWGDGTSSPASVINIGPGNYQVLPIIHAYANAGTYTVTFTVQDDGGSQLSGSQSITVS